MLHPTTAPPGMHWEETLHEDLELVLPWYAVRFGFTFRNHSPAWKGFV